MKIIYNKFTGRYKLLTAKANQKCRDSKAPEWCKQNLNDVVCSLTCYHYYTEGLHNVVSCFYFDP